MPRVLWAEGFVGRGFCEALAKQLRVREQCSESEQAGADHNEAQGEVVDDFVVFGDSRF